MVDVGIYFYITRALIYAVVWLGRAGGGGGIHLSGNSAFGSYVSATPCFVLRKGGREGSTARIAISAGWLYFAPSKPGSHPTCSTKEAWKEREEIRVW